MVLTGRVWKEGKFWLSEVPILDVMSQGRTKTEAVEMIADAIQSLVSVRGFRVQVRPFGPDSFALASNNSGILRSFLLKQNRNKYGISLEQMRELMGYQSRNAYAQYEQGKKTPTLDKMVEFLDVMNPSFEFAISPIEKAAVA